jgi:hypothetical protein
VKFSKILINRENNIYICNSKTNCNAVIIRRLQPDRRAKRPWMKELTSIYGNKDEDLMRTH